MNKTKIEQLKKEAIESCEFRGHTMRPFVTFSVGALSTCEKCGKLAYVVARPLPNEVEIGGSAITLFCEELG